MTVSSQEVKQFLLEVINQTSFPGRIAEFVSAVKAEIESAVTSPSEQEV